MEVNLYNTSYGKQQSDFYGVSFLTVRVCLFIYCNGFCGGGIIVINPIKKFVITESSFLYCSAADGGSIYVSDVKNIDISKLCLINSTADHTSALKLQNINYLKLENIYTRHCISLIEASNSNMISLDGIPNMKVYDLNSTKNIHQDTLGIDNCTGILNQCIFLNDTTKFYLLQVGYDSSIIMNNSLAIYDQFALVFTSSYGFFNNCTLTSLRIVYNFQASKIIFQNCFIEFADDFSNSTAEYINVSGIENLNTSALHFHIKCHTGLKQFQLISGNVNQQVLGISEFNIKVYDAYFENFHTSENGAAINLQRRSLSCYINFSSFYYCTADCGGAIYIGNIMYISLDYICSASCTAAYSSFANMESYSKTLIASYLSLSKFPQNYYSSINIIALSQNNYKGTFKYLNTSNSCNYRAKGVFSSSIFEFLCAAFHNITTECFIIYSKNLNINQSSFCYNSASKYLLYSYTISMENTSFYKNVFPQNSLYYCLKATILNCSIDDTSLMPIHDFTVTAIIPEESFLVCMEKVLYKNQNTTIIIISVMASVIGVLLIVTLGCLIYTRKMNKYVEIEARKSQLSRDILNDFG